MLINAQPWIAMGIVCLFLFITVITLNFVLRHAGVWQAGVVPRGVQLCTTNALKTFTSQLAQCAQQMDAYRVHATLPVDRSRLQKQLLSWSLPGIHTAL